MNLLLISSSNVHGYGYLDHAEPEIRRILDGLRTVSFVPFALKDREAYTAKVRERLERMGLAVTQVRGRADIEVAEAIFVGGGNTFRLLEELYALDLLEPIRRRVREDGVPYIGSSAGTNMAMPTIKTTNDMPVLYPRSFDALGLVSYHINPHYLDPEPDGTHKGETREERINEFLEENEGPVIGLREGTMLRVRDGVTTLVGEKSARIFRRGTPPAEVPPGSTLP
ncbi:MAG: dipeptidase PepE [Acidobacteriota bacterium]